MCQKCSHVAAVWWLNGRCFAYGTSACASNQTQCECGLISSTIRLHACCWLISCQFIVYTFNPSADLTHSSICNKGMPLAIASTAQWIWYTWHSTWAPQPYFSRFEVIVGASVRCRHFFALLTIQVLFTIGSQVLLSIRCQYHIWGWCTFYAHKCSIDRHLISRFDINGVSSVGDMRKQQVFVLVAGEMQSNRTAFSQRVAGCQRMLAPLEQMCFYLFLPGWYPCCVWFGSSLALAFQSGTKSIRKIFILKSVISKKKCVGFMQLHG